MFKQLVIKMIQGYRVFSRYTRKACRFTPTCSEYAIQSVEKYGVIQGLVKAIRRILKCHPWHPGGYDPV